MAEETKNTQRFAAEGLRIEHVLHKLEKPSCFIGLFDEKGVETCLTEDGVFAVWAEDHGSFCKMNLSVRWDNRIHHIAILQKNGGTIFSLTAEETPFKFSTVKELIDKCSGTGLQVEGKKVELKTPAKRPQWLLNGAELMISVAMEAKLAEGNFARVYRGKLWRNKVFTSLAVKVCIHNTDKAITRKALEKQDKARLAFIREGQMMRGLWHPNIVKFFGVAFERLPLKIAMEFCHGGSLEVFLHTYNEQIDASERVKFAREASTGLEYLHKMNIVHRDLAVRNILISKYGVAKIADFGLSAYVEDLVGVSIRGENLPIRSMAPESLQKVAVFVPKSDVWSFGVVLYEIFTNGAKLFGDLMPNNIKAHIRRGKMPTLTDRFPPSIKTLMEEHCWIIDLDKRSTMDVVKKELERIQNEFPIVSMAKLMINHMDGVAALRCDEIAKRELNDGCAPRRLHQPPTTNRSTTPTPSNASTPPTPSSPKF